jgi:hypothetical protein
MSDKADKAIDHGKLGRLEYVLMPGRIEAGHPDLERHNRLYEFWKAIWGDFYRQAHSEETLKADDFVRADVAAGLFHEDRPVGVHLYTFFNLGSSAALDHTYWKSYSELDIAKLRRRDVRQVMTMEFFAMSPEWRKGLVGISLAEVLVGCGLKVFESSGAEAVATIARKDVKVPDIGVRYGFETLSADLERHNHPVDLIAMFRGKVKEHPSADVRDYVDRYWRRRQDSTGLTANVAQIAKIAA